MPRAPQHSRGTGPRATVKKNVPFTVGLGPSHATRACERVSLAMPRAPQHSRGTGPRATVKKNVPFTVGLGPSHATRACERVSLAMPRAPQHSRGTGPRATIKNGPGYRGAWALACHTRMRAGSPRYASRIPTIAGDRPPRYMKITVLERSRGTGPRATGTSRPGGLSYRGNGIVRGITKPFLQQRDIKHPLFSIS